ncbi:MAG: STAS domain-containing protein [Humidesulfovibrio sp.]|nr:STAS domain-containing protein [Humidesulfovibrio sp.]
MEFTKNKEGVFLVLAVTGRLDAITARDFEEECKACIASGEKRLVVDLAGLEYISSAGLRSILAVAKLLKPLGGDLAFCDLAGIVAEVFAMSGFAKLLPVFATRQEALARA